MRDVALSVVFLGALALAASLTILARSTIAGTLLPSRHDQVVLSSQSDLLPTQEIRLQGWGYRLVRDTIGVSDAVILREFKTNAELDEYVRVNRALARELTARGETDLSVMITFRQPMPIQDFRDWVSRSPIQINAWELHYAIRDGSGQGQVGGRPDPDGLISERQLALMLSGPGRSADDLVVKGISAVDGQVQSSSYEKIANDPAVYLADVTRSAAREHAIRTVPGLDAARLTSSVRNVYDLLLKAQAGVPFSYPRPSVTGTPAGVEPATKSRVNPMTGR